MRMFCNFALMAVGPCWRHRRSRREVQLRAAQQKETVEGELSTAIAMYRKIADDRTTPPDVAARHWCGWDGVISDWEARKRARLTSGAGTVQRQTAAAAEAKQLLASIQGNGLQSPRMD